MLTYASRQVLRISRYGVRSRRGDVHQVGDKCAAASTAWQELVSILALPDAIKGEVQRATYRFQNAQKAAAKAIEIADDEASKKGLWDEVTAGHSAFAYMDILFEMRGRYSVYLLYWYKSTNTDVLLPGASSGLSITLRLLSCACREATT